MVITNYVALATRIAFLRAQNLQKTASSAVAKMYADDHDSGWYREEEMKLSKQYGGDFIRVRYNEQ